MPTIEEKVDSILARNSRVEYDKAWETSLTRRLFLAALTYIAALALFLLIRAPKPYLAALVPAGAYMLQQYSMPLLRKMWEKRYYGK